MGRERPRFKGTRAVEIITMKREGERERQIERKGRARDRNIERRK